MSTSHAVMLGAYERRTGRAVSINQGQRTLAEQAAFYRAYKSGRGPLAARPTPSAPHIKFRRQHHALDINAPRPARDVAAFYRQQGVPVAFNVRGEPWHMDVLDEGKLKRAARALKRATDPTLRYGHRGPSVVRLKKLLHAKGMRNFSGAKSSNRYNPFFGKYTVSAVMRFQARNGLLSDGIVGAATWKALRAKSAAKAPATKPAKPTIKLAATKASAKALEFIAAFEGGQSKDGMFRPYRDPVGVWTIGYGHTTGVTAATKPITKGRALSLLRVDVNATYAPPVARAARAAGLKLKQHEFDALVSFVYNLGPGVLDPGRSMGDAIARKNRNHIADAFLLYDKAGTPPRPLPGLTRRRAAEARLFKTGIYT